MNVLTVLVGIPGSGKSTYVEKNKQPNEEVLSSDRIRKELLSGEEDQTNNKLVFDTLYARARDFLSQGKDVIIDATNISLFERRRVLQNFADMQLKRVAIVFETPVEVCIERDEKRQRTVGRAVIEKYARKYQKPRRSEGFDEIVFVKE